jgi:hypothetical protein
MNVGIGTVAAHFLSWEYLFRIFDIVSLQCEDNWCYCMRQSTFPERFCLPKTSLLLYYWILASLCILLLGASLSLHYSCGVQDDGPHYHYMALAEKAGGGGDVGKRICCVFVRVDLFSLCI